MADLEPGEIVEGRCGPRFQAVRDAFQTNFASGKDVGASVALTLNGELVVDLWGGFVDEAKTTRWRADTITGVASTTKTMTALCALLLADRGDLDLDAPVARYWPEFAAAGKSGVLVRHLLGHTSGLPGWTEKIAFEDLYDWDKVTSLLAAQEPWWSPGTASAYHATTQGFLVGEVVRRITGQSLGTFFAREIAGPLGVDFHIGLPPEHDHRLARGIAAEPEPAPPLDPSTIFARIALNPIAPKARDLDERWLRAEIPAGNGIGNARAVAVAQSLLACGGSVQGHRLMSSEGCRTALRQQSDFIDLGWLSPVRWAMGFALSLGDLTFGPDTCFWGGSGGSLIVVDFGRRMTFAYVMNKLVGAPFGDPRNTRLVAATYQSLAAG
jgi:CubicO group peptidase (beta-lactamase class C family)